ncbi:MAG: GNAT family N-acetyltransferase [Chloroflexi bacterium]|nr:GNAT family N-acetyltransferase [Chloroflexota bacterium]
MTMTPPVVFECVTADALARDDRWWQIYDDAFPAGERDPREVILGTVRSGVGLAVRAAADGGTVGLATVHLLQAPAAVFLVYLAVAAPFRGRKIGEQLLEHAWRIGASRLAERGLAAMGLVWEVDVPALAATAVEANLRRRRIAFYHRHGGAVLPRPYAQPPLDGGAPVPMLLMYRPAPGTHPPDPAVAEITHCSSLITHHSSLASGTRLPDPAMTEALVRAIYFEKYGSANGVPAETLEHLRQAGCCQSAIAPVEP